MTNKNTVKHVKLEHRSFFSKITWFYKKLLQDYSVNIVPCQMPTNFPSSW